MGMKTPYMDMDPQTRKVLEEVESRKPANLQLEELKKVARATEALQSYLQKQVKTGEQTQGDIADVLMDVRDALDALTEKEDPEFPDVAQSIKDALNPFKEEIAKAIASIDVKPEVKVSAPDVVVPEPRVEVNVDLEGVEKAFQEAVDNLPTPDKAKDYSDTFEKMIGLLKDIDRASRMKPLPPSSMKVQNMDGSVIGQSVITRRFDINGQEIYVGEAVPGTVEAALAWKVTYFNLVDQTNAYGKVAQNVAWTNHLTETYV